MHPQHRVSLPGIHEMFPNYLALSSHQPSPNSISTPPPQRFTRPSVFKPFSFDVLRSDPTTSSLQHISSSSTFTKRGLASAHDVPSLVDPQNGSARTLRIRAFSHSSPHPSFTPESNTAHRSRDSADNAADNSIITCEILSASGTSARQTVSSRNEVDTVSTNTSGPNHVTITDGHEALPSQPVSKGKKHECSMCGKRFNRPSSLRIHVNTHTGATPFRCPHPTCGREFNVNSNMRRHYRNHALPALNRAPRYPSPGHGMRKIARGPRTPSRSPGSMRTRHTRTRSDDGEEDELNSDDEYEDSDDDMHGI